MSNRIDLSNIHLAKRSEAQSRRKLAPRLPDASAIADANACDRFELLQCRHFIRSRSLK